MNRRSDNPFRLLFDGHLRQLLCQWLLLAAAVAVIDAAVSAFDSAEDSVWDQAAPNERWLAFVWGISLTNRLLRTYVANGRTRREFMIHATVFLAVSAVATALLTQVGYAVERAAYGIADLPQQISSARLFTSASDVPQILLTIVLLHVVWMAAGAFVYAGFTRSGAFGVLTLVVALALATTSGLALRLNSLPFLDAPHLSLAALLPIGLGSAAIALALLWTLVHDADVWFRIT